VKVSPADSWTAVRRPSCTNGSTANVHSSTDRPPAMIAASMAAWCLRWPSRPLAMISRPAVSSGYWTKKPIATRGA
jgi:hypothetical protein